MRENLVPWATDFRGNYGWGLASFAEEFCTGLKVIQWMVGAMYFNIRSFLHLVGASAQKESCAINLGNEYVCCAEDWKTTLDKIGNLFLTIENNQI